MNRASRIMRSGRAECTARPPRAHNPRGILASGHQKRNAAHLEANAVDVLECPFCGGQPVAARGERGPRRLRVYDDAAGHLLDHTPGLRLQHQVPRLLLLLLVARRALRLGVVRGAPERCIARLARFRRCAGLRPAGPTYRRVITVIAILLD